MPQGPPGSETVPRWTTPPPACPHDAISYHYANARSVEGADYPEVLEVLKVLADELVRTVATTGGVEKITLVLDYAPEWLARLHPAPPPGQDRRGVHGFSELVPQIQQLVPVAAPLLKAGLPLASHTTKRARLRRPRSPLDASTIHSLWLTELIARCDGDNQANFHLALMVTGEPVLVTGVRLQWSRRRRVRLHLHGLAFWVLLAPDLTATAAGTIVHPP